MIGGAKTPVTRPVDLGLPSGTLWAPTNLDISIRGGFARSEFQYGCSYVSWANIDAHNPTGPSSFAPWSFGQGVDTEPYADSPGAAVTYPGTIPIELDIAHYIAGGLWRIPSPTEWLELITECDFIDANGSIIPAESDNKLVVMPAADGSGFVVGIRLRSPINGRELFLACTGYGRNDVLNQRGAAGVYWTNELNSETNAKNFRFNNSRNSISTEARSIGLAIRAVMSPP